MASESHGTSDLVLTPMAGAMAGLAGSGLMLMAAAAAAQPLSSITVAELLTRIGNVVPIAADVRSSASWGTGLVFLVGALLGLLYAACQRRVPARGLVAVGLFYGFVIWLFGGLLAGALFGRLLHDGLRSWSWFVACVIYGIWLALVAIWVDKRYPATAVMVPQD